MRSTAFWEKMNRHFGETYAQSVARDYVLAELNGRTVEQAFADGVDTRTVWRAVCGAFDVPDRLR